MCSICVVVQQTPQSNLKEERIQMAAAYVPDDREDRSAAFGAGAGDWKRKIFDLREIGQEQKPNDLQRCSTIKGQ
jgi:hypothetical protein